MTNLEFGKIYHNVEIERDNEIINVYKFVEICVGMVSEQFGSKIFVPYTGTYANKPIQIFPENSKNCSVVIIPKEEISNKMRLDEQNAEEKRKNSDFSGHPIYFGVDSNQKFYRILMPDETKKADIAFKNIKVNTSDVPDKLKKYGRILTDNEYYTDPAIGREKEIEQLEYSLATYKKNPLLVGKPGLGKTAIVEGFAYRIQRGLVPDMFKETKIISISPSMIISGTKFRGDFEKNMQEIILNLKNSPNTIPFIDEFHNMIGLGMTSESGSLDAANILKPYLASGELKIIGATTDEELKKHILTDKAFRRRLEPIEISEPTKSYTCKILLESLPSIERFYKIKFPFEGKIKTSIITTIVDATLKKNRKKAIYNNNPDLALSILYKVFASAQVNNRTVIEIDDLVVAIENYDEVLPSYKETFKDDVEKLAEQYSLRRN